jgi:hypothetical protein
MNSRLLNVLLAALEPDNWPFPGQDRLAGGLPGRGGSLLAVGARDPLPEEGGLEDKGRLEGLWSAALDPEILWDETEGGRVRRHSFRTESLSPLLELIPQDEGLPPSWRASLGRSLEDPRWWRLTLGS